MRGDLREVYLDFPHYQLGSLKRAIEDSSAEGLLFSELDQLVNSGFKFHHICSGRESAYDLALSASSKILRDFKENGYKSDDINALIYATCLPINANCGQWADFEAQGDIKHLITYPASKLQAALNLDQAIVLGIDQQACTSMLGGLRLAKMFLETNSEMTHILCLTADLFPPGAKYEQSYNLISDGAAGAIVTSEKRGYRLLGFHQITNGAMAFASDDETVGQYFNYSKRLIDECLERIHLSIADIDYIIPQNTNRVAWEILSGLLDIPVEKVLMETLSEIGHCISGDNIINLHHLDQKQKLFKSGDKILMMMAGFGLNWQCCVMEKV